MAVGLKENSGNQSLKEKASHRMKNTQRVRGVGWGGVRVGLAEEMGPKEEVRCQAQ